MRAIRTEYCKVLQDIKAGEKSRVGAHLEVHVPELCKVGTYDLVGVHKNDFAEGQRKQDVQEQDFVGPDDALLLRLQGSSTAGTSGMAPLVHKSKHMLIPTSNYNQQHGSQAVSQEVDILICAEKVETFVTEGQFELGKLGQVASVLLRSSILGRGSCLLVQPGGPLVGHELVVKAVVHGHLRQEALHLRRHVVFDEPELHAVPAFHTTPSVNLTLPPSHCMQHRALISSSACALQAHNISTASNQAALMVSLRHESHPVTSRCVLAWGSSTGSAAQVEAHLVVRRTERIMIFCSRSYMWPLATVKMWMQSGSSSADSADPADLSFPPGVNHEDTFPHTDPAAQIFKASSLGTPTSCANNQGTHA